MDCAIVGTAPMPFEPTYHIPVSYTHLGTADGDDQCGLALLGVQGQQQLLVALVADAAADGQRIRLEDVRCV